MPATELVAERLLFDTSAIFALTDQEDGWQIVESYLVDAREGGPEVAVCAVSLMELYYVVLQEQGEDAAARLVGLIKSWPIRWLYPDEKALLLAGRLKAAYRLSFADAVIAGVAQANQCRLVHKDPEFLPLVGQLPQVVLPLKGAK